MNRLNSKIYLKIVCVIFLNGLLGCLLYVIIDRAGTRAHIYNPLEVADYEIKDKNKTCEKEEELLFEDKKYEYYLTCKGSYNIYLEWTDGSNDLIKNALKNKKVTMDSLIEHGLKVIRHEKK